MAKVRKFGKGAAAACIGLAPCLGMAAPADYYECPPAAHGGKVVFSNSLSEAEAAARNCVGHQIAPNAEAAVQAKRLYRCASASWPGKQAYTDGLSQADAAMRNCTALENDWQSYGRGVDGTTYEYNARRLDFNAPSGGIDMWLRVTLGKPGVLTFPGGRKVNYHYTVSKGTAFCSLHTFQEGVGYYYDKENVVWTDSNFKNALPLPPDSALDGLMRELCTGYVAK